MTKQHYGNEDYFESFPLIIQDIKPCAGSDSTQQNAEVVLIPEGVYIEDANDVFDQVKVGKARLVSCYLEGYLVHPDDEEYDEDLDDGDPIVKTYYDKQIPCEVMQGNLGDVDDSVYVIRVDGEHLDDSFFVKRDDYTFQILQKWGE